jgi:hypothetical protein
MSWEENVCNRIHHCTSMHHISPLKQKIYKLINEIRNNSELLYIKMEQKKHHPSLPSEAK